MPVINRAATVSNELELIKDGVEKTLAIMKTHAHIV